MKPIVKPIARQSKPKRDIFGLTPEAVDYLVDDLAMLGKSQNQIVTNKPLKGEFNGSERSSKKRL